MRAILTVGVSASGKSTWAAKFIAQEAAKGITWMQIERDQIRKDILAEKGISQELDWSKWNPKWEGLVNHRVNNMINTAVFNNTNIVISDTNLNMARLSSLVSKLKELGYDYDFQMFPISFEEALERDSKRKSGVGKDVLIRQFAQWNEILKSA